MAVLDDSHAGVGHGDSYYTQSLSRARARVRAIFINRGVPADLHFDGSRESEAERVDRLARAVLAGERTFDDIRGSVDNIATKFDLAPAPQEHEPDHPWGGFREDLADDRVGDREIGGEPTDSLPDTDRFDGELGEPAETRRGGADTLPSETGRRDPGPDRSTLRGRIEAAYPYFPDELVEIFVDELIEHDDEQLALDLVRQTDAYDRYFPGNRREDGTLRFSEAEYSRQIEGYATTLSRYDLDPGQFEHHFRKLIEGDVRADQFADRVDQLYTQVMTRSDEIKQFYAEHYGLSDISDAALLGSAIDPDLTPSQIQLRAQRAGIGGAASESGFTIDYSEAQRLQQAGLGYEAAANLYRQAQRALPTLGRLLERHGDPDDDFTLDDFTDAVIFSDPGQMRRIERLHASEQAQFTGTAQALRDQQGRMVGLRER